MDKPSTPQIVDLRADQLQKNDIFLDCETGEAFVVMKNERHIWAGEPKHKIVYYSWGDEEFVKLQCIADPDWTFPVVTD